MRLARAGVRRLVHTSTHDVFHAERGAPLRRVLGRRLSEGHGVRALEAARRGACARRPRRARGRDREPSGVYGPGPSASVSFDKGMFEPLVRRRLPALPPGGLGLVFTEGVAAGHLLAADKGRDGERYILCDAYMLAARPGRDRRARAGRGWVPPTHPGSAARALAAGSEALSRLTRRPPLISKRPALLLHVERRARLDQGADRARVEADAARRGHPAHAGRDGPADLSSRC